MAEGSDGSGSEMGFEEDGGGDNSVWNVVRSRKRKKKENETLNMDETDSEQSVIVTERREDEHKVIVKLSEEGATFGEWNPIKLTKAINKLLGEVKNAKILRNGSLLIVCRNKVQKEKALQMNKIDKTRVQCSLIEYKKVNRGVITGIPTDVSEEEMKDNMIGAKVLEVKRLSTTRNGEKCNSLSVMIKFDEAKLPGKVYIGYMSYEVRPYIPPPLRCFKCQKYGHVAAICKGKQRCGRCAGEHEYGKCGEGVKLKCCNCGGEHSSAYRGCEASKRAVEVQRVKALQGITYAEAVKTVSREKIVYKPANNETKDRPANDETKDRSCGNCEKFVAKKDVLIMSKNEFVLFMVEVINCSAQTERKTGKIKIIVKAAEKYLGVKGLSCEMVEEMLTTGIPNSQSWAGGSS